MVTCRGSGILQPQGTAACIHLFVPDTCVPRSACTQHTPQRERHRELKPSSPKPGGAALNNTVTIQEEYHPVNRKFWWGMVCTGREFYLQFAYGAQQRAHKCTQMCNWYTYKPALHCKHKIPTQTLHAHTIKLCRSNRDINNQLQAQSGCTNAVRPTDHMIWRV